MMAGIISLRKIRLVLLVAALASSTFPHAIAAARERSSGVGEVLSVSASNVSSGINIQKKIFPTVSKNAMAASAALTQAGILYNGGPVMEGPVNVYVIYYGSWSTNASGQTLLQTLLANIGNTPYYRIQQSYTNAAGTPLSATVNFKGSVASTYGYSNGILLSDTDIENIVRTALTAGQFPVDASGVYFVLTSPDVQQGTTTSGFCNSYCGWHWYFATSSGVNIKYSFVGNPANCLSGCTYNSGNSPNGNPGIDGMASVILHELEEAHSDPLGNAWHDSSGNENADKCAWTFGTMYIASNGAYYNVAVGGKQYLLQQNWLNVGSGTCAISGPVIPTVAPVPAPVVKPVARPVPAPVVKPVPAPLPTPLAKPVPVPSPLTKPSGSSGGATTATFQLNLMTDSWGYETGWTLNQVAPTAVVVLQTATGSLASNTPYKTVANLGPGTYTFVITDQYGDGLLSGSGWYNLTVGGALAKSGGNFATSETTAIFVGGLC